MQIDMEIKNQQELGADTKYGKVEGLGWNNCWRMSQRAFRSNVERDENFNFLKLTDSQPIIARNGKLV